MRRWLLALVAAAALWFAYRQRAELGAVWAAWSAAKLGWLAAALLLQAGFQLATAALYRASLAVAGAQTTVATMAPTYLGAMAVNVAAPSGGATGTTWMVDRLAQRGLPPARSAAGLVLGRALSFSSFLVVMILAVVLLGGGDGVSATLVPGGAIVGVVAVAVVAGAHLALLALAARAPARLAAWLARAEALHERWRARWRPEARPATWSGSVSAELGDAARAVWAAPGAVLVAWCWGLLAYALDLACLRAVFAAFDVAIDAGPMIAGYALGTLFWVVPITPQGIGLVEGAMAAAFTGLGVTGASATAVAIAFRGVNFWLPLAVGVAALRGGRGRSRP